MAQYDIDPEEIEIFLEEMDELIEILEEDILKLEKESDNPSLLAEIFRAAHTLKGSAGSIGLPTLAELAHGMENVFDGVRKGELPVSVQLIDTFLKCTDTLGIIRKEIADHGQVQSEFRHHLDALQLIKDQKTKAAPIESAPPAQTEAPAPPAPPAPAPPEPCGALQVFGIAVHAAATCRMPFVRAMQVLTFLSDIGTVEQSQPAFDEIERESASFPLFVRLNTPADEMRIREVLGLIEDVEISGVRPQGQAAAQAPDPAPAPDPEPRSVEISPAQPEPSADEPSPPLAAVESPVPDPQPEPESEPSAPPPKPSAAQDDKKTASRSVRVNVERVDAIMDLVGELVIKRTRLTQLSRMIDGMADDMVEEINETADHIEHITAQLQDHILKARLLPLENVFHKFPRMVRDLSHKVGKQIKLEITGEKTELDRSVLEQIGDPLMHIMRNCVDHGIESPSAREAAGKPAEGSIRIDASHVEDHVIITVEDDGGGIDTRKVLSRARERALAPPEILDRMQDEDILNLVFTPGFSTRDTASELSGRGVGMDVVRTNIEKLNGSVILRSEPGKGTRMLIKLPLTLAIISCLLVRVRDRVFAVPLISVVQTLRVEPAQLKIVKGRETILFEDAVLPLVRLDSQFGIVTGAAHKDPGKVFIVVVSWGGQRAGFVVDALVGDQDIVIRPLGEYVGEVPGIAGAAILGDGNIALIIDVGGVVKRRSREFELMP
jgi:two-component system chemotaxis sensor kinase CheA